MKLFTHLFIGLFTVGALANEAELGKLLKKLEDEHYETRQQASKQLAQFPEEYAKKFLKMSKDEDYVLEVRHRLRAIAFVIFINKVYAKSRTYLEIIGEKGFDASRYDYRLEGLIVDSVYPLQCADGKLEEWDIITEIDGQSTMDWWRDDCVVIPNKEYTFKVMRPKNLKEVRERGYYKDDDEFEEVTVKFKTSEKVRLNDREAREIRDTLGNMWRSFVTSVFVPKPLKPGE
jgi:hypothetical protein